MVTVVVLALLASAAALTFAEPLRRARGRDAADRVRSFDGAARRYARRFGCDVRLTFDLSAGTLARRDGDRGDRAGQRVGLPGGYRIDRLRTAGPSGRSADLGEVTVPLSAGGAGPSYAVHLVGPGLDQWLLVAGLTGEIAQVQDEADVERLFRSATTSGGGRPAARPAGVADGPIDDGGDPPPGDDAD